MEVEHAQESAVAGEPQVITGQDVDKPAPVARSITEKATTNAPMLAVTPQVAARQDAGQPEPTAPHELFAGSQCRSYAHNFNEAANRMSPAQASPAASSANDTVPAAASAAPAANANVPAAAPAAPAANTNAPATAAPPTPTGPPNGITAPWVVPVSYNYHLPEADEDGPYYTVVRGNAVGIFASWLREATSPLVTGVLGAIFRTVPTITSGQAHVVTAINNGTTTIIP
ncbi:hypothetical protein BDN71DRAFT_1433915 [Pleurotus eryngii]|uniref:Uncharacterized protein n=1 Tax=Pleurotus eryngii TaxID=5323 RepID=A0A9P5ZQ46_PLEER|nr:hypothetical protein BDN71DRAFT_1433915 [Pleurotus eryngii]